MISPAAKAVYDRAYYAANREKLLEYQRGVYKAKSPEDVRNANLKRLYGITRADWDAMLASQGGLCAICKTSEPGKKGFHVDHSHDTGKVRGLLCHGCNLGIGHLRDDPAIVAAALLYLQ